MKKEIDIMKEAIHVYGYESQVNKFIEEAGECIAAVMRFKNSPSNETQAHMDEELADLGIMLEQMNIMFDKGNAIKFRELKIERLEYRLQSIKHEEK